MKIHMYFDPTKPDEDRALTILEEWQQQTGLPPQKIMVMALLSLGTDPAQMAPQDDPPPLPDELRDLMLDLQDQSASTMREVRYMMDHVRELLEQGPRMPAYGDNPQTVEAEVEAEPKREEIPAEVIASLKKGVKPGFSLDE